MKKITTLSILLVGILLFSGCVSTQINRRVFSNHVEKYGSNALYLVNTINTEDSSYGMTHLVKNNRVKFLIQADALVTLKRGYKYFRIVKPIDTSSEMVTTAEELQKLCFDNNMGDSVAAGFGVKNKKDCSFRLNNKARKHFNIPNYAGPNNVIAVYKEKPNDSLTIDAQEVIDYLKLKDIYINYEKID